MTQLLDAIVQIGSAPDLEATLHRTVGAAMALTDARYGAVGVRAGADGTIGRFIHDGMDPATAAAVGHLPVGKGLLGVPLHQHDPIRIDDVSAHPSSVGFPEHHPPMRAFMAVPISIFNDVFGSLYLTDDDPSRSFSESDEIAARALVSAAAVAIEKAQLLEQTRATATWMKASREISTALLSGGDLHLLPLKLVVDRARELTGAEQAIVLLPADAELPVDEVDELFVAAASGLHTSEVQGQRVPVDGSTSGGVFRTGTPVITASFRYPIPAFTDVGDRQAIVMPLRTSDTVAGVIAVARHSDQPPFDNTHLDLMGDFADQAAMALTLNTNREQLSELKLLEERERIARDLHDHVISGSSPPASTCRARSHDHTLRRSPSGSTSPSTIFRPPSRTSARPSSSCSVPPVRLACGSGYTRWSPTSPRTAASPPPCGWSDRWERSAARWPSMLKRY